MFCSLLLSPQAVSLSLLMTLSATHEMYNNKINNQEKRAESNSYPSVAFFGNECAEQTKNLAYILRYLGVWAAGHSGNGDILGTRKQEAVVVLQSSTMEAKLSVKSSQLSQLSYLVFHFSSLFFSLLSSPSLSPHFFLFYLVSVRNIMLWGRMPNRIRKLFSTTTIDPLPIKRKTE